VALRKVEIGQTSVPIDPAAAIDRVTAVCVPIGQLLAEAEMAGLAGPVAETTS
jgi:hypothetical protein